jgi:hypothetical protein
MFNRVFILFCLVLASRVAFADDRDNLIGTWKLSSCEVQFQDGGASRTCAAKPLGYLIFTAQGRMMALLEDGARMPGKTDEELAALFRTVFAYTGTYRLEGDKWITTVDAASIPAWRGTDQVRSYKLEAGLLQVTSAWAPSPVVAGAVTRLVLAWERGK